LSDTLPPQPISDVEGLPPDEAQEPVELLTEPSEGVPELITTAADLAEAIERLAAGTGPVAVDAERAHGFRYSQRAYLLQLRRHGAGTHMVDPVAFGQPADLRRLGAAIADAEWVIHAASQDLACLYEVGLTPRTLFDTELAGRLLGYPRVALGTMVEQHFGVRLLKEHSAADWSTRPLPAEWLVYAALDVELLLELRDILAAELQAAGKLEWARQEFAALVNGIGTPPEPRVDPWRRTSGMHRVRTRRGLAYVAALWRTRDQIACELDRAPGRILGDAAITELAASTAPDRTTMRRIPLFARRLARRFEPQWVAALESANALRDGELPPMHLPHDGPPPPRVWASKDPVAAERLTRVREALLTRAAELEVPIENLLTPDFVRRLAWRPPTPATEEAVDAALAAMGARPWQRELTVPLIVPRI
jgi:ribonuclease D